MQLNLQLDTPPLPKKINYQDKILLIGSCFTEHISERLAQHKFDVLNNPNGIIFNPASVADVVQSYVNNRIYDIDDLFLHNELWNSWLHHTRFSNTSADAALETINASQREAIAFVRQADYIIISLGSAFCYRHKEHQFVAANNHRVPAQDFQRELMETHRIYKRLSAMMRRVGDINRKAKFIFTISPVRHIRDGVIENNRSKGRLIEAVHQLCGGFSKAYYFPAYELVIDILRDYRYYDIDFVHPNYMATQFVWEHFVKACIAPEAFGLMEAIKDIVTAANHKTRFPQTEAHKKFLQDYAQKISTLSTNYPFLNLEKEAAHFKV